MATTPQTVWVLLIENQHGYAITVHSTRKFAHAQLASYCAKWWDEAREYDESLPETPPQNTDAMIEAYFDGPDTENYDIHELIVDGLGVLQLRRQRAT